MLRRGAGRPQTGPAFLRTVIDQHPYLPVVAVGQPRNKRRLFFALRASRYLESGSTPGTVAGETVRALHSTWWWALSQCDLPTLIVNPAGIIRRANRAAEEQFGPALAGRPYRAAVERGGGDLPPGHPIREALGRTAGVSRYHEYPEPGKDAQRPTSSAPPCSGCCNRSAPSPSC